MTHQRNAAAADQGCGLPSQNRVRLATFVVAMTTTPALMPLSMRLGWVVAGGSRPDGGSEGQLTRPQGPVPESFRGDIRVTYPSGKSSPGGGNWPPVIRRSRGTAPPSSTRAIPWITT
jgi:hypothetical protein